MCGAAACSSTKCIRNVDRKVTCKSVSRSKTEEEAMSKIDADRKHRLVDLLDKKISILLFPGRAITKHVVWKANEQVVREKKKKQFHNFTLRQLDDDGSYSDETVLSLNALFSFFIYHSVLIFVLSDGSKVISPWIPSVMCAKTRLVMGPVSRTSSASGAKERSTQSASLKHG